MSFYYDYEDLGYETGYETAPRRETKKNQLCMGEPEQVQINYKCDGGTAAASSTGANPTPPPPAPPKPINHYMGVTEEEVNNSAPVPTKKYSGQIFKVNGQEKYYWKVPTRGGQLITYLHVGKDKVEGWQKDDAAPAAGAGNTTPTANTATPAPNAGGTNSDWQQVDNFSGNGFDYYLFKDKNHPENSKINVHKQGDPNDKITSVRIDLSKGNPPTAEWVAKAQTQYTNAPKPVAPGTSTQVYTPPVTNPTQTKSLGEARFKKVLGDNLRKDTGSSAPMTDEELDTYTRLKFPPNEPGREAKLQQATNELEGRTNGIARYYDPKVPLTRQKIRDEMGNKAIEPLWNQSSQLGSNKQQGEFFTDGQKLIKNNLEARGYEIDWNSNPPKMLGQRRNDGMYTPATPQDRVRFAKDCDEISAKIKSKEFNSASIKDDTSRRVYLNGAYEKYKAWAMADPGKPPNYDKGLGLKGEADVRKRFDKLTTQLKLTNPDGTPAAFNPNATGENDPAQALFPVKEGETRFKDDGTMKGDVKLRHENPSVDDSAVNPVTRVVREQTGKELGRDTLYASLTGQVPEGSSMKVVKEEGKTFLVGPDGNKTEITVVDPPFTRKAALAYMQSKNLVDSEGAPLPDASLGQFASFSADIKTENVDRDAIKNDITKWERQEIVKTLSGPPHNMKGQQIVRYMQSKGWLGDNPNLEAMEDFRKKAVGAKEGSNELRQISEEVKKADVVGNDPIEQVEKDRADEIREMLDKKGKNDENRAGRGTSRDEGALNRDMTLRTAKLREDRQDARDARTQKFQRTERLEKQKFDAKQAELQRKHDAEERALDRKNQMMMSLIQFLGSMITAAMQSMTTVMSASIQSTHGLGNERIASMRGGRQ